MGYDEIMLAFFLAILSFCVFALAWAMVLMKGYVLSAVLSLLNIVLALFSAKGWLQALVSSGKSTEAPGYGQYPLVPVACGVLLLGSLVCFALSLILLRRQRAGEAEETRDAEAEETE